MTTILPKNTQNLNIKHQQQNIVCLEQQIYASPENFTLTLLMMLETFRRSGDRLMARWGQLAARWGRVVSRWGRLAARWARLVSRWGRLAARWGRLDAKTGGLAARWANCLL